MLDHSERGIATKLGTRARPGHAHMLWYDWEVLAIEKGGNQTISSDTFTTAS